MQSPPSHGETAAPTVESDALGALRAAFAADENACRPSILRLRPGQWAAFRDSCAKERVRIHDRMEAQLRELARIQLPGLDRAKFDQRFKDYVARRRDALLVWGSWVYYPWRRAVTHLLPRDAFHTVRTNRNREKVTVEEQATLRGKKVGVIGLSVGHAAALVLAQEGIGGEIRIADFDTLELSNLNRLRSSVLSLGLAKSILTARDLAEIDPYLTVRVFEEGVTDENVERFLTDGGKLDLLVEECDNLAIKLKARERARALGIPVVMDTNDRGLLDVERFDREPGRPLLHGLVRELDAAKIAQLDAHERLRLFYSFLGGEEHVSTALRDSVRAVGKTLVGLPQLASDVHLGGALVANAARRILLGKLDPSGRWAIDLNLLIGDPHQGEDKDDGD